MQHQLTGTDSSLSLQDRYRAASMYEQSFRLLLLDQVRTAEISKSSRDVEQLEAITDEIKGLLFDCAHTSDWIMRIAAEHPSIVEGANHAPELRVFISEVHDRMRQVDLRRFTQFVERVPDEAKAAVRELEKQMRALRAIGGTEGDMSSTARCALYGFGTVAAIFTGGVLGIAVAFAAGFGAGADRCI